ncbi:glucan biosynthesis protein [Microvirga sp. W0021]|uniref:Glucan biosynthesis protein n=1 Tax=Hohaiivirga grylli TaxID=3133970 RepID=A0ABV0BIV5_9HYPH
MSLSRQTINRRKFTALLGASAITFNVSAAFAQSGDQPSISTVGEGMPFSINAVSDLARQLSKKPFVPPSRNMPDVFANLNYEQYASIRSDSSSFVWANENWGFAIEPLHRGFVFSNMVRLYTVEDGVVRRIPYDQKRFSFGSLEVPPNLPEDLEYSGFRLHSKEDQNFTEFAIVQGATFFQAIARGQNYGSIARALTLKPADMRGEEFPVFKAFWIERPTAGSNALVINGLIDSESTSGSIRLTFRPGEMTIVDVEMTLFPRAALEHIGIGAIGSRFFFSPNENKKFDDLREAVHDANGLGIHNGQDEWLWRPLKNPESLQISQFMDKNPKGFGLIQRYRDYTAYRDDSRHLEKCPSVWIEPLGEWGEGVVQMIEIPSDAEINSNILTYWRPGATIAAGSEVTFNYRQYWCWNLPERPQLATVTSTRSGKGSSNRRRKYLVEFSGDNLTEPAIHELKADITARPGSISNINIWRYTDQKTIRVTFEMDPGNENASELRLVLMAGDKPASEIWLYRWTA